GTLIEKGAVCGWPPARQGRWTERAQRKESSEDVVAPFNHRTGHDRAHYRRAQRQEIYPGICDRADDRAQAGRVRADALVQGPLGEGSPGKGGRCGSSSGRGRGAISTSAEGI